MIFIISFSFSLFLVKPFLPNQFFFQFFSRFMCQTCSGIDQNRPLTSYNKRESCASSATTTTLLGPPSSNYASQRGSNGALHLYAMPRAISPLMQVNLHKHQNIFLNNVLTSIDYGGKVENHSKMRFFFNFRISNAYFYIINVRHKCFELFRKIASAV